MKKNDIRMGIGICLFALVMFVFYTVTKEEGNAVRVQLASEELGIYLLREAQVIEIGDGNRLEIKDGKARMIFANCPDKRCLHQRAISATGESIICLPNKVSASVTGHSAGDYDAVAG